MSPNPFTTPTQKKSVMLTFRMTPAEHEAVRSVVGDKRSAIVDFIRRGLYLAMEENRSVKPAKTR